MYIYASHNGRSVRSWDMSNKCTPTFNVFCAFSFGVFKLTTYIFTLVYACRPIKFDTKSVNENFVNPPDVLGHSVRGYDSINLVCVVVLFVNILLT